MNVVETIVCDFCAQLTRDAMAAGVAPPRTDECKRCRRWRERLARAASASAILILSACGLGASAATANPNDDAGDAMGQGEAGPVVDADAAAGSRHDAEPTDAGDSSAADAGNADAGSCVLNECDCPWLAANCSFYTPAYPCGVSAACGQAFDVDPQTCGRTVHTATTDAGACVLHDDGVTWCCS